MLKIDNLHFKSEGRSILNGVSFEVNQGQTIGVIGPNGSGKTTLFNCLSGFVQTSHGSILLEGKDIGNFPPHKRALAGIGRVFQSSGVFKQMSVGENIEIALDSSLGLFASLMPWFSSKKRKEKLLQDFLSKVGLEELVAEKASSLSGGELRLLEIVRCLAFGAKLFLLDEPCAGVSPKMKQQVGNLITQLRQDGLTILIIEHDMNFIQSFCDRIIVLDQGRVVMDGAPEEVRRDEKLQEVYFGVG